MTLYRLSFQITTTANVALLVAHCRCRIVLVGKPSHRIISGTMNVHHEIELLVQEIERLGNKNAAGQTSVKFGVLFNDDRCANIFEALVGTLRAAKKRKVVSFQNELLLQGVHDDVDIVLLKE
nr:costars family protein ABRACL-like [Nerophis lumbriciformis]